MAHEILGAKFTRFNSGRPHPYPKLVSEEGLTPDEIRDIRRVTALAGRHSYFNAFTVDGVESYGHKRRFELSEIAVSKRPFDGVEPKDTDLGNGFHGIFRDEKGQEFPVGKCSYDDRATVIRGIIVKDDKGRGWLCGNPSDRQSVVSGEVLGDPGFVFTGEEALQEISLDTIPVVADFFIPEGMASELSRMPTFAGEFVMLYKTVGGTTGAPIGAVTAGHEHLMPGLIRMNDRIDEILERERRILEVVENVVTDDAIRAVIGKSVFPMTEKLFPAYDAPDRRDFDKRLEDLAKRTAIALRDAGFCAPCPNHGHHDVRGMKAWETFLEGRIDGPASSYDGKDFYAAIDLDRAPFFRAFTSMISDGISDFHEDTWKAAHPGERYDFKSTEPVDETRYAAGISGIRSSVLTGISREDLGHLLTAEFRSSLDANLRLSIDGSFLKPVLATTDEGRRVPLPLTHEPKHLRHLTLSVPSGRLVVAEWPRVKGFTKGVEDICEGDSYELGAAGDLDLRARDYYERMGVAIIQIGNGPKPYHDVPGVIRFGKINEDDPRFRIGKNGKVRHQIPEPAFEAEGPVRCRTMGDVEAFVDVMMASDEYEARQDAMDALEAYAAESDEMSIIDFGDGEAHLYAPTGYGERKGSFQEIFRCPDMKFPAWMKDEFVLSDRPLDVAPDMLEDHGWVEGRIDPRITLRREDDSPEP